MNRHLTSTLLIASLIFSLGCEGGANRDALVQAPPADQKPGSDASRPMTVGEVFQSQNPNAVPLLIVAGDFVVEQNCLKGTGALKLPARPSDDDSWNLGLQMQWAVGSELSFYFHSNADRSRALELHFIRTPVAMSARIWAQGAGEDWSGLVGLQDLFSKDQVSLTLDIHHDSDHQQFAHLVFFDEAGRVKMDSGRDTTGTPGKGEGREVLLDVQNIQICDMTLQGPRSQN